MATKKAPKIVETPYVEAKDEMNLAEFPIALLTAFPSEDIDTLVFEDSIKDSGTNKMVSRKLTITAPIKTGLPRGVDEDVIVALIQLTKIKNSFTSRKVQFSRNELITLLGWPYNGKSYQRLEDALDRWMQTTLSYENAWWDKSGKTWETVKFHILDNYGKKDSRARNACRENLSSEIYWNETVFNSFASGNLRNLDYRLYLSLDHASSKRIFRYLDKHFYRKPELVFDLKEFAFAHVGLSQNYSKNVGKIKEKLKPAIEELTGVGFLEPLEDEKRFIKQDLEWKVVFKKLGSNQATQQEAEPVASLALELISRGITPITAKELARNFPAEIISKKIEIFDWLMAKKDKKASKSPSGYLVSSIRGDYKEPQGFKSKATLEAEQLETEKAQKERDARKFEADAKVARDKAEDAAADAHLAGLDATQRAELEREAFAASELNPRFFGRIIVREYVKKMLLKHYNII